MDDQVLAALRKWPNVPACTGWLALDARGQWFMRDERTQHAGPFPQVKGSRVDHAMLRAFIERNYEGTAAGDWYFQNGPQRVYVELEAAPWVWRLGPARREDGTPAVATHTGREARVLDAWTDEHDRLFLRTDLGFGIVHTQDMLAAADAIESGCWPLATLRFDEMPGRFGYRLSPHAAGVDTRPGAAA